MTSRFGKIYNLHPKINLFGEHFELPHDAVTSHLPSAIASSQGLLPEGCDLIIGITDVEETPHAFKHTHLDRVEHDEDAKHYRVILKNGVIILCSAGAIILAVSKMRTHSKHRRR